MKHYRSQDRKEIVHEEEKCTERRNSGSQDFSFHKNVMVISALAAVPDAVAFPLSLMQWAWWSNQWIWGRVALPRKPPPILYKQAVSTPSVSSPGSTSSLTVLINKNVSVAFCLEVTLSHISACRLCVWTILVPEDMHMLFNLSHLDVESCHHNYLAMYSLEDRLVGKWFFTLSYGKQG